MAPTNAKLKDVDDKISDQIAHIEALQLQAEQAKIKLDRLREERAAVLETFADYRRFCSPFRNLPEDVLREICIACVQFGVPELSYGHTPMPYILSQTCGGMRHVALNTPIIWAAMSVNIRKGIQFQSIKVYEQVYAILARRAIEWFERAGALALSVIIEDADYLYTTFNTSNSDPTCLLFDALLRFSTRWKEFEFISLRQAVPKPLIRIASLTASDVPMLQSVSICLPHFLPNSAFEDSELLRISSLRRLTLSCVVRIFAVNWAVLTSITINGDTANQIGRVLQETRCLQFCNIVVHDSDEHYAHKINLPVLKTLIITNSNYDQYSPAIHSILEAITAPILEIFENNIEFLDLSLVDFIKRSPHIRKLSLICVDNDKSLMNTTQLLRHCPSLSTLFLWPRGDYTFNCDRFLQAFVEERDDGVICPGLQDFTLMGGIDFSLPTLSVFLEGKHGAIALPNVLPWKKVVIDVTGIRSDMRRQKILNFASEKRAAGFPVRVYSII